MFKYKFFIDWRGENTASSLLVCNYDIKDNALFLYGVTEEEKHNEISTTSYMVIPFSSIRYFTYTQREA